MAIVLPFNIFNVFCTLRIFLDFKQRFYELVYIFSAFVVEHVVIGQMLVYHWQVVFAKIIHKRIEGIV